MRRDFRRRAYRRANHIAFVVDTGRDSHKVLKQDAEI